MKVTPTENYRTPPAANFQMLPLLGTVSCGYPTYACEHVEDLITVPGQILKSAESAFLLRVKGDAMSGEGIMPRDLIVVMPTTTASDGELVVVLFGDDALLGRFVRTRTGGQIEPRNPAYSPIEIVTDDCSLVGRVIGLLRDYVGSAF